MLDLALSGFAGLMFAFGLRRPFLWVLAYLYIDIVSPQKLSYFLLASIPISLIVFTAAFGGWLLADDKSTAVLPCGRPDPDLAGLLRADDPYRRLPRGGRRKWAWVWKALVFAIFLPLTLRTRLRLEAVALIMVLSAASIVISGSIKTLVTGRRLRLAKVFRQR